MPFNFLGYFLFTFAGSVTPGPNNLMLFSYGRSNNIRQAVSLMAGIQAGFFTLLYLSGYGIAQLIMANHTIEIVLKILSSLWLIYLGFILRKIHVDPNSTIVRKIGFKEAYMMQFINPKAWVMAIAGASAFMPSFSSIHLNVFVFAIAFCSIGVPCMLIWLNMSKLIEKILKSERANRNLGYAVFAMMVISAATIWIK